MIVNERKRFILLYRNIGKLHLQNLLFYTILQVQLSLFLIHIQYVRLHLTVLEKNDLI